MQYYSTVTAKLVYIFTIDDSAHKGCVKIGETTLDEATSIFLTPNSKELNAAARKRIDQYTKTAGIHYTLRHTELTLYIQNGVAVSFNDKEVHNVLLRSGIKRHDFSSKNQGSEWFECTLDTALKAIKAVKEGRSSIGANEIVKIQELIEFRPEQQEAIDKTVKKFNSGGKTMLWNAKMRFGKTLSALQVVKECGYKRTIIITHRPVVDKGWFEDFGKLFTSKDGYVYGSREEGEKFEYLEKCAKKEKDFKYIYFASIQDLRGAQTAGGKYDKNAAIFAADYDMLIIDEAHEGTQTEKGQNVISLLIKENTHVLNLSGTPFNLLDDYSEDEIFTWDYVMEQKAKANWDLNHFGDPNPYAGLPRLNIFTFDIGKVVEGFEDIEDKAFNFTEFFRVWTGDKEKDHKDMPLGAEGKFIYEEHVKSFLDLIVKYDVNSNYPYSTPEFRDSFRHSLWMIPGVKQARALSALLQAHPIFGQFDIVNVAGDGDEDVPDDDALALVNKAIGDNPEDTRTITLSCGKLTTGVSVKPWTAVMYLAGSHNTDAKAYMQTIFRVQTPYTTKNGCRKENCYVFDFAPDRTLKVLATTAKVSNRATSTATDSDRIKLGEFLNFCPVIGYNGTKMNTFNVEKMLEELKKAYITRVTKNGCDDPRLYNMEMLQKLDKDALSKFQGLKKIIGSTKASYQSTDVDMAKNGLTDEQYRQMEKIQKKKKRELTEEEKRLLEEAKEKKENAAAAISILRGISIRLPLLMYGADLNGEGQDITLENFAKLIDDQSWIEFMPKGVTKELFKEFIPYYDPDMFRAVGRNYRDLVRQADKMAPLERVKAITSIFEYFRNPDKETVLTPWRVVNMHIGDCIGGQVFFEKDTTTKRSTPRFVDHGEVTEKVFKDKDTRILEINSKTGLYPLYMAYSVFAERLQEYRDSHMLSTDIPIDIQNEIWDRVLKDNIFIICKTEMAKSITKRTLRGFRSAKVNARYFEDLINKITNQPQLFLDKVVRGKQYWKNENIEDIMKFNAIVGNPPYQINVGTEKENYGILIFGKFINISKGLEPNYISMIIPARWYAGGRGLDEFRDSMLHDNHLRVIHDFTNSYDVFPSAEIQGGVCYFLWEGENPGLCSITNHFKDQSFLGEPRPLLEKHCDTFIRYNKAISIIRKVQSYNENSFSDYFSSQTPFGIITSYKGAKHPVLDTDLKMYISGNDKEYKGGVSFAPIEMVVKGKEMIPWHKVFIPCAYGGGMSFPHSILGKPFYGEPYSICNQSYLVIGPFCSKVECENVITYIKSRFLRFLVLQKKNAQHAMKNVYQLVPAQDWSKPWTDEELYKKYNLSDEEIKYIESMIKPMNEETSQGVDEK